jgi:hypothetical protein
MSEGAKHYPKSIKDTIRIYVNVRNDEPIAYAVHDYGQNIFNTDVDRLSRFAVLMKLKERPKFNPVEKTVTVTHRYDFGGHPEPISKLIFPDPGSHEWVNWKPIGQLQQSIHFMLLQGQDRLCSFQVDFKKDWTTTKNHGFQVTHKNREINPLKRTEIEWLAAWQLPYWEKEGFTGKERFERIQNIAKRYGIEPWGSQSSFNDCLAEIKKA